MNIFGFQISNLEEFLNIARQFRNATPAQRQGIWSATRRLQQDHRFRKFLSDAAEDAALAVGSANFKKQLALASLGQQRYFVILAGYSPRARMKLLSGHPIISRCHQINTAAVNDLLQSAYDDYLPKPKPGQVEFWMQLVYAEYLRERILTHFFEQGEGVVDFSDNLTVMDRTRRGSWAEKHHYTVPIVWVQGQQYPDERQRRFEPPMQNRPGIWQVYTFHEDANPESLVFSGGPKIKKIQVPANLLANA